MRPLLTALFLVLAGCWGDNAYIVEGTVLEKTSPTRIVVAHEDIHGLMSAMTMSFDVRDPALLEEVGAGDRIYARLMVEDDGSHLARVRVIGQGSVPAEYQPMGPDPLSPAAQHPRFAIPVTGDETWTLGEGQGQPTLVTYLFTQCPLPEFCPAILARLQALQPQLPGDARILVLTLDPANDTLEVLTSYAGEAGADPERWRFGRVEGETLEALAYHAGLPVMEEEGEIVHGIRFLVLDGEGRLVERYDDTRWPMDRVVEQLATGAPRGPLGVSGTVTPPSE